MQYWWYWIIIGVCAVFSAFFSAADLVYGLVDQDKLKKHIKTLKYSEPLNVIHLTRLTKTLLRKNGYEQLWNITKERSFPMKNGMLSIVRLKRIGIICGLTKGISPSGTWFTISMRILLKKDVRILFSEAVFPASVMT